MSMGVGVIPAAAIDETASLHSDFGWKTEILEMIQHYWTKQFRSVCRFRSCLKMARTSQSRFVGRLFFDLLSKQCFVFKKVRRCARLSWDGSRCIRKRWAKKAVVRNGMNYY